MGLATPTEAAAVGALGALSWPLCYGRMTYAGARQAVLSTTATSSMVLLLAVTSNIFGAVFSRLGTADWVTEVDAGLAAVAGDDADLRGGPALSAGMAVRMAGDHPGVPADLLSGH